MSSLSSLMANSVEAQIEAQNKITDKFFEFLDSFANNDDENNSLFFKTYTIDKGNEITRIKIPYLTMANIPNFQLKSIETELKVEERNGEHKITSSDRSDYNIRIISDKPENSKGLSKLLESLSELITIEDIPKEENL